MTWLLESEFLWIGSTHWCQLCRQTFVSNVVNAGWLLVSELAGAGDVCELGEVPSPVAVGEQFRSSAATDHVRELRACVGVLVFAPFVVGEALVVGEGAQARHVPVEVVAAVPGTGFAGEFVGFGMCASTAMLSGRTQFGCRKQGM